jgi:hypothetical protein
MKQAGFRDVVVEAFDVCFAEVDTELEFYTMMRELAGPIAALLAPIDNAQLAAIEADVIDALRPLRQGEKLRVPGVTWIAAARK